MDEEPQKQLGWQRLLVGEPGLPSRPMQLWQKVIVGTILIGTGIGLAVGFGGMIVANWP